ncbi:uncharacterized protein LOC106470985 [Limulus polyphemus]|uniref:Uncharacterized protein LOC106470985 n=1 Tax=Limulus polyphemus TaxID=6850 RepID=A0ABM1BR37_LIMPO|nr:uncharacterized protein LOC106470985 [Limulus polyphemus]
MAFMMPVVRNEYEIYPSRSRRGSNCSQPRSRRGTRSESATPSLSCSPESDVEERMANIAHLQGESREQQRRCSSQCVSESHSPNSASNSSLNKFHNRLVDKLKRKLKIETVTEQIPPKGPSVKLL